MSRFDSVPYDDATQSEATVVKHQVQQLESSLEKLPVGRYKALALTALEECHLWHGKALRDEQLARTGQKGG